MRTADLLLRSMNRGGAYHGSRIVAINEKTMCDRDIDPGTTDYYTQWCNMNNSAALRMTARRILAVLILTLSPALYSLEVYEYENSVGDHVWYSYMFISPNDSGYDIEVRLEHARYTANLDRNYELVYIHFIDRREGIDLVAKRKGDRIFAEGKFRYNKVKSSFRIDGAPWCLLLEFNFPPFIRSDEPRFQYWLYIGYHNAMYKLEAEKIGTETLVIRGKSEEAVHIRVRPVGIYAMFWQGDYWFRKSDYTYLQDMGVESIGASPTVTQFIKKSSLDPEAPTFLPETENK
jgi:hypothetical protein